MSVQRQEEQNTSGIAADPCSQRGPPHLMVPAKRCQSQPQPKRGRCVWRRLLRQSEGRLVCSDQHQVCQTDVPFRTMKLLHTPPGRAAIIRVGWKVGLSGLKQE